MEKKNALLVKNVIPTINYGQGNVDGNIINCKMDTFIFRVTLSNSNVHSNSRFLLNLRKMILNL